MSKRTRNRQLARVARRRQAEKRRRERRKQVATIAVALVVALAGGVVAFTVFTGGEDPAPGPTGASGATGESPSPTPSAAPGTQTGTVDPQPGPKTVACGADVPRGALRPKPQFNAPAEVVEKNLTYTATFETSCGEIVVELLADRAPATVNSFVFLAQEGYFDGTRVHRLDESIDVIQGGDPTGTGTGGPGYAIPDELVGDEIYGPGVLAMANSGTPGSGGSQFFLITGEDGHHLETNAAYTIFGQVLEGQDVAELIQGLRIQDPGGDIAGQQPAKAVYIEQVTISTEE